jgi:predicted RNA-binding Zn ribbon-like protein
VTARVVEIAQAMVAADATGQWPPPVVPPAVVPPFLALAKPVRVRYVAVRLDTGHTVIVDESTDPAGDAVALLAWFFRTPVRTRLRQCPVCGRWFVDRTRNASARRCSHACTIRWTNTHRAEPMP